MKILISCLILATFGLTLAKSTFPFNANKESEEISALLQSDGVDNEDIATLQGVFNVLAQVEEEKAKTMKGGKAMKQGLGMIGNSLWNGAKHLLKKRYCNQENQNLQQAMVEELGGEQVFPYVPKDRDAKAMAELQMLFNALKLAKAKVMQDGGTYAKMNGWWDSVKNYVNKKAGELTKSHLC